MSCAFCLMRWPRYHRPAIPATPKRKITTRKPKSTLTRVLPPFDGAAAAACATGGAACARGCGGGGGGAAAWAGGGAACAAGRVGGPLAEVPHLVQKTCASAKGEPQFLQKPAMLTSEVVSDAFCEFRFPAS